MILIRKCILTALIICITGISGLIAQPSLPELADEVNRVNQERLSDIETLEMTVQVVMGETVNSESTNRYVKEMRDGKALLVPDSNSDQMFEENETFEGIYDGSVEELIRGAESIENDQLNGKSAYKLTITDQQLLRAYEGSMPDEENAGPNIEEADFWIDSDLLVPLKMVYRSDGDFSVEIIMDEYEMHFGLPVAKKMTMNMKGMSSMFSEEERAEARRSLEELRNQLEQMPESQREMIESQMSGQMEQLEQILESGEKGTTTVNVTNVSVNE